MADREAEMKAAFVAEMEAARAEEKAAEKKAAEKKAAFEARIAAFAALPKVVRDERAKKAREEEAAHRAADHAADAQNEKSAAHLIALRRRVDTALVAMNTRDEECRHRLTIAVSKRRR